MTQDIRPYGPGKFDTILDSYVWQVGLDGCDDEAGDVHETGRWYGLMANDEKRSLAIAIAEAAAKGGQPLIPSEAKWILEDFAGVILSEDSQGFVTVDYYNTEKRLKHAWNLVVAEVEEMTESDETEG